MRRASTGLVVVVGLAGLVGCTHMGTSSKPPQTAASPAPAPASAPQTTVAPPPSKPPPASAPQSGSTGAPAPATSGPAATAPKPAPSKTPATGGGTKPPAAASTPKPTAAAPKSGASAAGGNASASSPAASSAKPPAGPPSSPPAAAASSKPPAAATTAPATLDLNSLEQRLKDTHAIGVFTKLSLKNQVDDLLDDFRAFHRRQAQKSLSQLRQQYDVLLLKVLSLLQDGDPSLASAISSSREAIWGVLTDPEKFSRI
jgi:hypothetical protein